jgi:hypothetical protein
MEVAIQMMDFLFDKQLVDEYLQLTQSICYEYYSQGKFVEASYMISQHVEILKGDDTPLLELTFGFREKQRLPPMTSWDRKVYLIETAIDMSDRNEAQDWERCIQLVDLLVQEFKRRQLSLDSIRNYLNKQLKFYDRLATEKRVNTSYFLVKYSGNFREELLINPIIYRGKKMQTVNEFSSILAKKYPDAMIQNIRENNTKSESSSNQIIKFTKVHEHNTDHTSNRPPSDLFIYSYPMRKNKTINNEFLDLWVEKHIIKTAVPLPSIFDKADVIEDSVVLLNPIEVATEALKDRNKKILLGIKELEGITDNNDSNKTKFIAMDISGTVDAAVNGGLNNYFDILSGEYKNINPEIETDILNNPEKSKLYDNFVSTLKDHFDFLGKIIELHRMKCHESILPLQNHFEKTFNDLFLKAEFFIKPLE